MSEGFDENAQQLIIQYLFVFVNLLFLVFCVKKFILSCSWDLFLSAAFRFFQIPARVDVGMLLWYNERNKLEAAYDIQ